MMIGALLAPQIDAVLDVCWLSAGAESKQVKAVDGVRGSKRWHRAPPAVECAASEAVKQQHRWALARLDVGALVAAPCILRGRRERGGGQECEGEHER